MMAYQGGVAAYWWFQFRKRNSLRYYEVLQMPKTETFY